MPSRRCRAWSSPRRTSWAAATTRVGQENRFALPVALRPNARLDAGILDPARMHRRDDRPSGRGSCKLRWWIGVMAPEVRRACAAVPARRGQRRRAPALGSNDRPGATAATRRAGWRDPRSEDRAVRRSRSPVRGRFRASKRAAAGAPSPDPPSIPKSLSREMCAAVSPVKVDRHRGGPCRACLGNRPCRLICCPRPADPLRGQFPAVRDPDI